MLATYTHISTDKHGKILAAYRGLPSQFGAEKAQQLDQPAEFDPSRTYFDGTSLIDMGEKPTERSVFDYILKKWVEPEFSDGEIEFIWIGLRVERNRRLSECDWTQAADAPVDQAAWAAYRQALRDLPANTVDPRYPVWPTPPA